MPPVQSWSLSEELACLNELEKAQEALTRAVTSSDVALDELSILAEELRVGELFLGQHKDNRESEERFAEVLLSAVSAARLGHSQNAGAELCDALRPLRLSKGSVNRIISRLEATRHRSQGRERAHLAATLDAIRCSRRKSEQAMSRIIGANLALVVRLASRHRNYGLSEADLVQEGTIGLMRALDKFDSRRGLRFHTYAAWWIRHFINRALSDKSRTIRVPVHALEARNAVSRHIQGYVQERGRSPSEAELARRTRLPPQALRDVLAIPERPLSLDAPHSVDSATTMGELIADTTCASPFDDVSVRELSASVRTLLKSLSPRHEKVLKWRFGFDGSEPLSFDQIGKRLRLSGERVRQIEIEALASLRVNAQARGVAADLAS